MAEITSLSQLNPDGYYTYQDYLTWKFKERVELFKGVIAKMSPAPNRRHQEIFGHLFLAIGNFLSKKQCKAFAAPFDVRLPVSNKKGKIDTVVQPDICVVCNLNLLDEQGCNGAPDLVIEILSPGNSIREMKDKFELYEQSKISEYWIVDPQKETVIIYSLNGEHQYIGSRPHVLGDKLSSAVLNGLEIDVTSLFVE